MSRLAHIRLVLVMANGQLILIGILIFNVMHDYNTLGSVGQQKSESSNSHIDIFGGSMGDCSISQRAHNKRIINQKLFQGQFAPHD